MLKNVNFKHTFCSFHQTLCGEGCASPEALIVGFTRSEGLHEYQKLRVVVNVLRKNVVGFVLEQWLQKELLSLTWELKERLRWLILYLNFDLFL